MQKTVFLFSCTMPLTHTCSCGMEINNDAWAVREHLNGKKHREGLERMRLSKNNFMAMFKKKSAPQTPKDVPSSSSAITATSASSSSSAATDQVSQPSAAPKSEATTQGGVADDLKAHREEPFFFGRASSTIAGSSFDGTICCAWSWL